MASSLSILVNNLSEIIHRIKYNFGHNDKRYCDCFLEYTSFRDDLIEYKCLNCNKNYQHMFEEKLKERLFSKHNNNHDNNKFILLLQKVVHPYEYIDHLEILNETSLPGKEDFYIHLNMEDITDAD